MEINLGTMMDSTNQEPKMVYAAPIKTQVSPRKGPNGKLSDTKWLSLEVAGDRYSNRKPGMATAYNDPAFDQNDQNDELLKKMRVQDKQFLHDVTPYYYGEYRQAPVRKNVSDMGREGRRLHADRMNPDNILNTNNKL